MRRSGSAHLALVHHANQYVIGDGYADRQGISEILGLRGPTCEPAGLLPLLRMHLEYRVPLNLHCSGTLLEALAWHCPQTFSFIKRLRRAGLLELIGGAFSQNVMPFFSETVNRRQLDEELALYRRHLQWDLRQVRCFWVPERVWDTKLAALLRSPRLLNGGYRYVLLDDRLVHAGGESYAGSARERFDRGRPLELESFLPWEIGDGHGLVMLPISRELRYAIPPSTAEALERLEEILRWMAASGDDRAIAIYGDDLEKAAGVGGWDPLHPRRYEQLLEWFRGRSWIRPVLLSEWVGGRGAAGVRTIERGTFYELARCWQAGEDYRGWHDDPNCAEHRRHLTQAEQALAAAAERGADAALLDLGWRHLLHCSYETSWHDAPAGGNGGGGGRRLAGWAAALTSHARSCLLLTAAAEWAARRDGTAQAELADLDADGDLELVVKNRHLLAVFSPRWGGRLTHLFDLTGRGGRLVIGNVSDDWNLQEELNRYMDCPPNHPGALAEVGHEHDRYEAALLAPGRGAAAVAVLRNVEPHSPLRGTEKRVTLTAEARHLSILYSLPPGVRRLSTEACLSPDYRRLLRRGRDGLETLQGRRWRGWRNGSTCAWVRIDPRQWTLWDAPRHAECGHGLNLRITALASPFEVHVGVGTPRPEGPAAEERSRPDLTAEGVAPAPRPACFVPSPSASDARVMRRFLSRNLPEAPLPVRECRVSVLKPHHDRLTLQYDLVLGCGPRRVARTLVGTWRKDGRGQQMYDLLRALRRAGMDGRRGLSVPEPLAYWKSLRLLLLEKARGQLLRQWVYNGETDWSRVLRPVADWLAALHGLPVEVPERLTPAREIQRLWGWWADLSASREDWLAHELRRIESLVDQVASRLAGPRPCRPCLTHGDFHPENVLLRGRAVTAIDFEHACMADPASDLGFLLAQIEIQRDRYWRRHGIEAPAPLPRLAGAVLDPYGRTRPPEALALVPVYRAQTFLQHLAHTLRMKGTEDPRSVTRWLDRAGECLGAARYLAAGGTRPEPVAAAFGFRIQEGWTMASAKILAQQAAAREEFERRIARISAPEFIESNVRPALPADGGGAAGACRVQVIQNDGTGPATLAYELSGGRRVFAKLYGDESGRHAYRVLTTLWNDGFGADSRYRVAEPLGFFPALNMLLVRGAAGSEVATAPTEEALAAGAREAARWLVRLHGSRVRLGDPRYPWDAYHKLLHRLAKAAAAHPDRVDTLLEQADRLEQRAARMELRFVQAHGQYRHIHVFVADESVTVIDLDRSRPGDPARDVGEFLHRMRAKRYKATAGASRAEQGTAAYLEEYAAVLPRNLANLPFYWGYHALVSLWRFMKGSRPEDPRWAGMVEFYLSELDTALSFRAPSL